MLNQNIPTRPCPTCDEGKVYTGERGKGLNPVNSAGVQVCSSCKLRDIYQQYFNGKE